jgi:hypothetical protein
MDTVLPETASEGKFLTDAWDYEGHPATRATTGGWACAATILGNHSASRYITARVSNPAVVSVLAVSTRVRSMHFLFGVVINWLSNEWTNEGAELFERMTTLGIAVNLVPYMTGTMHLGNAAAANTVTNFIGSSFMLCLLGGFIADTYLGRYLTIGIFTAVQATVRRLGDPCGRAKKI